MYFKSCNICQKLSTDLIVRKAALVPYLYLPVREGVKIKKVTGSPIEHNPVYLSSAQLPAPAQQCCHNQFTSFPEKNMFSGTK